MTRYDADGNIKYYITYVTDEDGNTGEYKYDGDGNLVSID